MADQNRHDVITALKTVLESVTGVIAVFDASKIFDELPADKLPSIVMTEGPTQIDRRVTATLRYQMEVLLTVSEIPKPDNLESIRDLIDGVIYALETDPTLGGTAINTSVVRVDQPIRWPSSGVYQDNVYILIEYRKDI